MPRTPLSLRFVLASAMVLGATLAVLVSGALVVLTTAIHNTTVGVSSAGESVRIAQEAEIKLLLHARTDDPIVRRELESELVAKLDQAHSYVATGREAQALEAAKRQVSDYLGSLRAPAGAPDAVRGQEAFGALQALVSVNVEHARALQQRAAWWDRMADWIGTVATVMLLSGTAMLLLWLRRRAFAPVFSLARAMQQFARGDRRARAPERGAAELREMSRRFNEMADALSATRSAQIAFLGGVAHDLRNPLSVLRTSMATLRPDAPLPQEPRLRRILDRINRQITRMERMINDFLGVAKIEAGELSLTVGDGDLREVVEQVVELFHEAAAQHRVVVSIPNQPVQVSCDQLRIEQVLTNLISNALKYSPAHSLVEVALERAGPEVVLRVTDQGAGISAHEQQRLFEPFHRAGLSSEAVPGVGLGLFVVKRLVEAHGGRIEVDSEPGRGSCFRVVLPAQPPPAVQRAAS